MSERQPAPQPLRPVNPNYRAPLPEAVVHRLREQLNQHLQRSENAQNKDISNT